jgi:hypothetical protein
MATIDASLDELTGATIIITATIISTTDRSRHWDAVSVDRQPTSRQRDEARRIAANIAKRPELLQKH